MKKCFLRASVPFAVLAGFWSSIACAGTIYINSPTAQIRANSIGEIDVGTKFRESSTNFDQSLDSGGGTGASGLTNNFLGHDLGNITALNGKAYNFSFQHINGQGFIYSMTPSAGGTTWTQAWGTFSPALSPVPQQSAATLPSINTSPFGTPAAPDRSFNALHIEARAQNRDATYTYNPTVSWSNLTFTSPGLTQIGSLVDGSVSYNSAVPPTSQAAYPDVSGYYSQWLLSTTDLNAQNWTLGGTVTLSEANPISKDVGEYIRFDISGKTLAFTTSDAATVPEPSSLALLGLGGVCLAIGAYRRSRATTV